MTTETVTDNRREHPRYPRRVTLDLGPDLNGETVEMSKGGFSASMLNHFTEGQVIKGGLAVSGRRFPFHAQVRWTKGHTRFGASFITLDETLYQYTNG